MIHLLPDPIESYTHVQVVKWTDHPGSGIVLRYRFGSLDAEGEFVSSRFGVQERAIVKPVADQMRQRAADAGAPVTAGVQEYRAADVLAVMDADGLW